VSTDPGIWGWTGDIGQLGFTVTFSLGRSPEDVLSHYGADPAGAQQLSRDEAWALYRPNYGGAQLRAGTVGRWGFCFEEAGVEGIKPRTLSRLSADTEAIAFFTTTNTSHFIYLKDGEGVEAFEPGLPETVIGEKPWKFWADTQKITERASQNSLAGPMGPSHAVLQAISKHIRGLLDRATLQGPLLTAFLSDADRAPANAYFDDSQRAEPAAPAPEPAFSTPMYPASANTGQLPRRPVPAKAASAGGFDPGAARAS
jgi:Family of unknown function (DUF6461)